MPCPGRIVCVVKAFGMAVVIALVVVASAAAVGPWPGTVASVTSAASGVKYSVTSDGTTTELRAGKRTASLPGTWAIPAVTTTQLPGGLSPDGRLLVLVQQGSNRVELRAQSKLLVVSTRTLRVRRAITLAGEFGFDALSADDRVLYVIEHRKHADLNEYVVRAYDLVRGLLVDKPVVAEREDVAMRGYSVSRVASTRGTWVYTLYWRTNGTTFVHALATTQRRAVCLDLKWTSQNAWNARLQLSRDGKTLRVRDGGSVVETVATPT